MIKMKKAQKLKIVNINLMKLGDFLNKFLPVANAHNCDFIVCDMWHNLLNDKIAQDLLLLSPECLSLLPSCKQSGKQSLDPSIFISDTTLSASQHHENNGNLRKQSGEHKQKVWEMSSGVPVKSSKEKWDKSLKPSWGNLNLKEFIREVNNYKLINLGVMDSIESLCNIDEDLPVHIAHGMSVKKSHEIERMTQLCFKLAESNGIRKVVDIGSGKGYLGCQLALTHQLNVLGIDSSGDNTKSAIVRTNRVKKQWDGLFRKASQSETQKNKFKLNKHENIEGACNIDEKVDCKESDESVMSQIKDDSSYNNLSCDMDNLEILHHDSHQADGRLNSCKELEGAEKENPCDKETCNSYKVHPCTKTDTQKKQINQLYVPITEYVTSDTDLLQMLHHHFGDKTATNYSADGNLVKESDNILLTGLHTCGDLASNVLKLFVGCNNVQILCNVGCCYHLIEEEFVLSPYTPTEESGIDVVSSFPLSQILRSRQYKLGRNARMLACQAPDRLVEHGKLPDRSLFWRALLQVILKDLTGTIQDDWHVGRIAAKCSTFKQYVNKAFNKLKIDQNLSDEEIEMYEEKYEGYHQKLNAFFQLKATLAPCIEALILLDRLAFLLEQDCTEEACLVELFDKVISPRCYALIATKSQ